MTPSFQALLADFDATLPLKQARTLPADWYLDPEMIALETRKLFAQSWLVAGRRELVSGPGTYLTAEIAGQPIVVVRDLDGVLRAFINVCRHRAAVVMLGECGKATRMRCRYHGWTYDLAGRLRGVPEF